eukprot:scaffold22507_cov87-Isochrysis_galbana.AAC.1
MRGGKIREREGGRESERIGGFSVSVQSRPPTLCSCEQHQLIGWAVSHLGDLRRTPRKRNKRSRNRDDKPAPRHLVRDAAPPRVQTAAGCPTPVDSRFGNRHAGSCTLLFVYATAPPLPVAFDVLAPTNGGSFCGLACRLMAQKMPGRML